MVPVLVLSGLFVVPRYVPECPVRFICGTQVCNGVFCPFICDTQVCTRAFCLIYLRYPGMHRSVMSGLFAKPSYLPECPVQFIYGTQVCTGSFCPIICGTQVCTRVFCPIYLRYQGMYRSVLSGLFAVPRYTPEHSVRFICGAQVCTGVSCPVCLWYPGMRRSVMTVVFADVVSLSNLVAC